MESPERFLTIFYRAGDDVRHWRRVAWVLGRVTDSEAVQIRIRQRETGSVKAGWGGVRDIRRRPWAGQTLCRFELDGGARCEVREQRDGGSLSGIESLRQVRFWVERGEASCRLVLWRRDGAYEFRRTDLQGLARLLPHAIRSVRLGASVSQARARQALLATALARTSPGLLVATAAGRILHMDRLAETWLMGTTPASRRADGRPNEVDPDLRQRVAALCQSQAGRDDAGQPRPVQILLQGRGVTVEALPRHEVTDTRPALLSVRLRSPRAPRASPEPALRVQGLTAKEARLACALGSGLSLSEFTEREGVSRNTARTHLRSLFSKLGMNRQVDLVMHVRALAACDLVAEVGRDAR